jgi:hypothetical protein
MNDHEPLHQLLLVMSDDGSLAVLELIETASESLLLKQLRPRRGGPRVQ